MSFHCLKLGFPVYVAGIFKHKLHHTLTQTEHKLYHSATLCSYVLEIFSCYLTEIYLGLFSCCLTFHSTAMIRLSILLAVNISVVNNFSLLKIRLKWTSYIPSCWKVSREDSEKSFQTIISHCQVAFQPSRGDTPGAETSFLTPLCPYVLRDAVWTVSLSILTTRIILKFWEILVSSLIMSWNTASLHPLHFLPVKMLRLYAASWEDLLSQSFNSWIGSSVVSTF